MSGANSSSRWSKVQRNRLAIERGVLEQYFPNKVIWLDQLDNSKTRIELDVESTSGKAYKLRLYLHPDFPNSCPHMAIVDPPKKRLLTKAGHELPLLDKRFHTLGLTVDGFTKLCHFSPDLWTADNTLYQVFIKGIMWIEAYEGHLDTGNAMDVYLGEQRGTANEEPNDETNEPDRGEEPAKGFSCSIS